MIATYPTPNLHQLTTASGLVSRLGDLDYVIGYSATLGADGYFRLSMQVTDREGWRGERCYVIAPDGGYCTARRTLPAIFPDECIYCGIKPGAGPHSAPECA